MHAQMLAGVEIPCTDGVLIGPDVTIGRSTRILPNTILRGNTAVGADCSIGPSVVLTDCTVGDGASLCFASCEHTNISSSQAVAPLYGDWDALMPGHSKRKESHTKYRGKQK